MNYIQITMNGSYGYKKGDRVPVTILSSSGGFVKARFKVSSGTVIVRRLKRTTIKQEEHDRT
jgi:hypothetical protein